MSYGPGFGDPNQLAQRITSNIQKITQCSAEIQRILHQLGTPQDTPELRQQLQQKQQYTNQLAKETDKYIKEFGSLPATSEQRQRKIQKDRLVGEFTTALTNFQRLQRQAAEKEKDFVARVRASSRVSGGAPEDNYKEGTLVSWDSQPQTQVQDEEITEDDLRLIEERESSIRQLEADIMDINEIFKDLGMMIHEQGDVIDSIEANVESADVHVQQANQQLSRAANYQREKNLKNPKHQNHPGRRTFAKYSTDCLYFWDYDLESQDLSCYSLAISKSLRNPFGNFLPSSGNLQILYPSGKG